MQQVYNFKKSNFDDKGFNEFGQLFADILGNCELEFHEEFYPFCANYMYANHSTMFLLQRCFVSEEAEDFGMDGNYDLETNLKIEQNRTVQTVFALESQVKGNEDEPLFLATDDKIPDGTILLKYIPDNDDDDYFEPVEPITNTTKEKFLING